MSILSEITELSHLYGADSHYTLAGGGNTSCKDGEFLYVKPSGVALATIREEDFVKLDRATVRECFTWGEFADPAAREAKIKKLLDYAVISGGRPSVETPLHEVMPFTFVVHMHPELVNGLTCSQQGAAACAKLFPDALWMDYCDPGYTLSKEVYLASEKFRAAHGRAPQVIFLQNHGVFVGGNSAAEIRAAYDSISATLTAEYARCGIAAEVAVPEPDPETVAKFAPQLRGWLGPDRNATIVSAGAFPIPRGPLTPDHLVYAKAFGLISEAPDKAQIDAFKAERGYLPRMIEVPGKACFFSGAGRSAALTVAAITRNGALIEQLAKAFGGVHYLDDRQRGFIENWEVESYRSKVAAGAGSALKGLVAVVTGGAQGFGYGIAQELAKLGADIVIADMNEAGAVKAASELGRGSSGFAVNIADEASVEQLIAKITAAYGGADLLVANAGVVRASSVKSFALKDWEFVTNINYNGFFLCVKHFANLMALQNSASGRWSDIVQVNSKSGLEGSKNNAAYAGSKFGTLGQVQSFALELVADKIKVNAVCPGNYLDGPLWSDPVRGLFVQYLQAGKVPGATTVAEVRAYYEAKVPMNRGCFPADVAKAILYAVTQQYETGQAIPVTGGQVMLN